MPTQEQAESGIKELADKLLSEIDNPEIETGIEVLKKPFDAADNLEKVTKLWELRQQLDDPSLSSTERLLKITETATAIADFPLTH
ncbi:hypothetical protein [Neorhizobium alkalisoli]|uniref:hypothetical protein n=1 Tax=Neorhizobium alkalisoli TaxID=528178 RepID=UPI000CF9335B|nr:hypothetical protein [Neorhizobium alkalisoli]